MRRWRGEPDLETEDGRVTYNPLQQIDPALNDERPATPLEEAGGTDPDGITEDS